ncbi:hypothetical protein ACFWBF_20445 [Streptomyces sp. NPDC060028]|uniref:hypothetical protein n=1 Tax=Streptomyces sp. NPDC060028 TaxID=3347041 RepID=UPI0036A8551C
MRLRTTAAAALAALALVLPTAGQSLANDHDDDRTSLGELRYRYTDEDGETRRGRIEPADNDTCYRLTHASGGHPAFEVRNATESLALLFEDRNCGGEAVEALQPGERAHDLEVRSVLFKPTRHHNNHNNNNNSDSDNEGRHDARHDRDDDEDRRTNDAEQSDLFGSIFRSVG